LEKVADSHKLELYHDVHPKSFSGLSTSSPVVTTERICLSGLPAEIYPCKILLQQKLDEWCEYKVIFPRCFSFSGIGKRTTFQEFSYLTHLCAAAHSTTPNMFANLVAAGVTYEIPLPRPCPDFIPFCGDRIGNLVMI
jgi:hypothetical protein